MTPEQLKASILQRAMEGKLVPQDPNDEPASELLKRIKAEKEKLIKEGKIKRDKNETEIYRGDDGLHYEKFADGTVKQVDVPFEIPESWEWVRLSSVINVVSARRVHKSDWKNSGIPFYRAREIGKLAEFGSVDNDLFITEELYKQYSENGVPKPNDLMVTAVGTLGKTYVVKQGDKFYYKDASVLCFENFSKVNPKFFQRIMETPFMKKQIMDQAMGTTVATLTISRANQYFVPIPPSNEQARIFKRIEQCLKLVAEYSQSYTQLETLNKTFPDKLRKSILQYAMQGKLVPQDPNDEPVEVLLEKIRAEKQRLYEEGKLKKKDLQESIIYKGDDNSYYEKSGDKQIHIDVPFDIPEHWKWVKLNYICHYIQRGKSPKYVEKSEIPIISQKCIQWSGFDLSPARFLDPKYFSSYDNIRLVRHNDLLWCSTGKGTVGRIGIFTDDDRGIYSNIVADSHVTVIRQFDEINSNFTLEYLSSPEIQMNMDDLTTGSTKQQELSLSTVTNILLPICGRSEQDKIISKITQFERYIYQIQIIV